MTRGLAVEAGRRLALPGALALVFGVTAALLFAQGYGATAIGLGDTDDAMRLVQVRALLDGRGWFDVHEPRLLPGGYDSHWSRLIDGGLAALIVLLRTGLDPALAERVARALWPMLWLLPAMGAVMALATRLAGRAGGLVCLVLLLQALPAYHPFQPGRIDHHNAQIAFALLAVAAAIGADRWHPAGALAGVAIALGLAVGLEGLPLAAVAGAILALRFVADPAGATALRDGGLALAGTTAVALATGLAPVRAGALACDALALNGAAALGLAGLGLALVASRLAMASARARLAALAAVGALALGVGLALAPQCAGGPFAGLDPLVRAVWLSRVLEMRSLPATLAEDPDLALALAAFPVLAAAGVGWLVWRRADVRRDPAHLAAAAAFAVALVGALGAIKLAGYALWLSLPLAAAVIVAAAGASWPRRLLAAIVFAPTTLALLAAALAEAAQPVDAPAADRRQCTRTAAYADLAALPPALVAAPVDYGPFILALTPHTVLAAPYHRLDAGIRAVHEIFAAPLDDARARLAATGAAYLLTCHPSAPAGLDAAARDASLWGRLAAGDVPPWLVPVDLPTGTPLRLFRIAR